MYNQNIIVIVVCKSYFHKPYIPVSPNPKWWAKFLGVRGHGQKTWSDYLK